ncbi:unnamed protein product [Phytophthora fragariaefolia]|uniref:Unnamed protein product n=1 Tax=Phytophthora fragariaefolia TaxID=1490495 RepID=A0A9W7D4V0_9STRA|nr:unnamed protein product [Phytophthora fragariaefolia]
MYDVVHVDEKWFNMYKASSRYYLTADESLPYRTCPNKRYIGKVMFLAAIARPRYDFTTKIYFDRKIGIWPIVERTKAKKTSKNRVAGTPITKNINMSRKIYVQMLKDKVFRQSVKNGQVCYIFDYFSPHVEEDHGEVIAAGQERGWKIKMACQPPRSPMCNILDLGIFNCIQSTQYRQPTNQIDGLIDAVQTAFNSIKYQTIEKCFLTLQKVMDCIIIDEGGNNFKLPRVGELISGHGEFPTSLTTTSTVVENGYKALTSQILNQ